MSYQTIVVGTDGSRSSLRAVDRAAQLATESDAKLVVATGFIPEKEDGRAADLLKEEAYMVSGNAPAYEILRTARERAGAAGATNVEERTISQAPVRALVDVAGEAGADLLVVGNVGLNAILGRLFSVPGSVATKAKCDVLIVHTSA